MRLTFNVHFCQYAANQASDHERSAMTKTMNALECKEKFLAVVDEVAATGNEVVVTRNGRPVGRIQRYVPDPKKPRITRKIPTRNR